MTDLYVGRTVKLGNIHYQHSLHNSAIVSARFDLVSKQAIILIT